MKKTIIVTIIVDEFDVNDIAHLLNAIEEQLKDNQYRRIQTTMQDEQMVKPSFPR